MPPHLRCLPTLLLWALAASAVADPPASTRGRVALKPVGYVQADVRFFPGWGLVLDRRPHSDGFDVRHMRGGLRLETASISGQAVVDLSTFANHALGDEVSPLFLPRQRFKDLYVDLALGRRHGLRAGHFKVPVSREFLVAEQRTEFMERALLSSGLAPGRDWGLMAHGRVPAARGLGYLLGVFAGDTWSETCRAGATAAGRVVLQPGPNLQVGLSGSVGYVRTPRMPPGEAPDAKGLQGKNASGWVFFPRPLVEGQRRRLGADLRYAAGALSLTAELLTSREERRGGQPAGELSAVKGLGWSSTMRWRLHGPPREEGAPSPRGSFDLAVRYESLRFAAADAASSSEAVTAGVCYEPRPWLRVMANGVVDRYGAGARSPAGPAHTITLLGRVQLAVP